MDWIAVVFKSLEPPIITSSYYKVMFLVEFAWDIVCKHNSTQSYKLILQKNF